MPTLAVRPLVPLRSRRSDERKLARRRSSPSADVVVADLEDAVAVEQKDAARDVVRRVLADERRPRLSSRSA